MAAYTPTAWPKGPFYLLSIIGDQYHALTAPFTIGDNLYLSPFAPSANQLWMALEFERGTTNTYPAVLVNLGMSGVIVYTNAGGIVGNSLVIGNTALYSVPSMGFNLATSNTHTGACAIVPLVDGAKCIDNVGGFGGHAQIETFTDAAEQLFFIVQEKGSLIINDPGGASPFSNHVNSPEYSLSGQTITVSNPSAGDNLIGSVELTYTDEMSYSYTHTTIHSVTKQVTASLGLSGIFAKVLTIDAKGSYSTQNTDTTEISSSETHTQSTSCSATVEFNLPPSASHTYSLSPIATSYSAEYSIPVTLHSSIPGLSNPAIQFSLSSAYFGSNTHSYKVIGYDVTSDNVEDHTKLFERITSIR